jgi:hypothetical protein
VAALQGRARAMDGDLASALEAVGAGLDVYPFDTVPRLSEIEIISAIGRYSEAEACVRALAIVGERPSRLGGGRDPSNPAFAVPTARMLPARRSRVGSGLYADLGTVCAASVRAEDSDFRVRCWDVPTMGP